jgi:hypothetical protein
LVGTTREVRANLFAATEHIFGLVASGQTDEQRLVVSGLSHLKSREKQAKAPTR